MIVNCTMGVSIIIPTVLNMGYNLQPFGGICMRTDTIKDISSRYPQSESTVKYMDMLSPSGLPTSLILSSDTLSQYFKISLNECEVYWNATSCQLFSNLCVLQVYDESATVCQAYQSLALSRTSASVSNIDVPRGLPWLYYGLLSREDAITTAGKMLDLNLTITTSNSGIENGVLRVIRIASTIKIWLVENNGYFGYGDNFPHENRLNKAPIGDGILVPILDIQYTERDISAIRESDFSKYSSPTVSFEVTYNMDLSEYWRTLAIVFAAVCLFTIILGYYIAYGWGKRNFNPTESKGAPILYKICGCIGPMCFWLLFSISIYYLSFYKGQSVLFVVIPHNDGDVANFTGVLIVAFVCQLLFVGKKVYDQCNVDIFFCDWEKTKGKLSSGNEESSKNVPISIWRLIFMANQWNSIQNYRRINVEILLLCMYFFLQGLGYRYAAKLTPEINDLTIGTVSPILLFAVNSITWFILVAIQLILQTIYARFYRNKILQYIDLLSLCNISLLLFDEKCHGYYIHGRSVHGSADTDMQEMNANLKKEENDLVPKRGLNDSDQQSFELVVSQGFKNLYRKVYQVVVSQENNKLSKPALRLRRLNIRESPASASSTSIKAYETINKFICSFIDKNSKEHQYVIRTKSYFEKLFGASPDMTGMSIFFHDELGISRVLLYGVEFMHLILLILLYNMIDILTDNSYLAILVTYVLDIVIRIVRSVFGERNISKKSLLDWKFLV
ncbi:Meckelin [Nowakowskiella sp. JEL0407]|nr:Meckelin [Nowakowskiella sp. JEL0407]